MAHQRPRALRALLERIVLVPSSKTDKLDVHIHGDLAGLLLLSMGTKRKNCLSTDTLAFDSIGELVLVAGVGFEPTTFRL